MSLEHFVPGENSLRVGADIAVDFQAEDDIGIVEIRRLRRGQHHRVLQRRNAVTLDAAPDDLVEPYRCRRGIGEVLSKAGIDSLIEPRLEFGVRRVGLIFLPPNPSVPPGPVLKVLPRFLRENSAHALSVIPGLHHPQTLQHHDGISRLPAGLDLVQRPRDMRLNALHDIHKVINIGNGRRVLGRISFPKRPSNHDGQRSSSEDGQKNQ